MTNPNEDTLDGLLAQVRGLSPTPSDDLTARVLADAAALQDRPQPLPARRPGMWVRMRDAIGGWPAVSGLAAATVAGIWIGIAPPSSFEALTATLIGDQVSISLFPTDALLAEGAFSDG